MTYEREIADASGRSVEPQPDGRQPGFPDREWLDGLATDDDDERRQLVRELVMRALV